MFKEKPAEDNNTIKFMRKDTHTIYTNLNNNTMKKGHPRGEWKLCNQQAVMGCLAP
jgi:hypothetical protein